MAKTYLFLLQRTLRRSRLVEGQKWQPPLLAYREPLLKISPQANLCWIFGLFSPAIVVCPGPCASTALGNFQVRHDAVTIVPAMTRYASRRPHPSGNVVAGRRRVSLTYRCFLASFMRRAVLLCVRRARRSRWSDFLYPQSLFVCTRVPVKSLATQSCARPRSNAAERSR